MWIWILSHDRTVIYRTLFYCFWTVKIAAGFAVDFFVGGKKKISFFILVFTFATSTFVIQIWVPRIIIMRLILWKTIVLITTDFPYPLYGLLKYGEKCTISIFLFLFFLIFDSTSTTVFKCLVTFQFCVLFAIQKIVFCLVQHFEIVS